MFQLRNIIEVVRDSYNNDEITIEEAARELYKHGFLNFSNDTEGAMRYITFNKIR